MKRLAAARPNPEVAPVMNAVLVMPVILDGTRQPRRCHQLVFTAIAGRPPPASFAFASASSDALPYGPMRTR